MADEVLVIGDMLEDHWLRVTSTRQSAEADIPIYDVISVQKQPGGAANVNQALQRLGIPTLCNFKMGAGNPIKTRLVLNNQQIVRFDQNDVCQPDTHLSSDFCNRIVVISDYNKGTVTEECLAYANYKAESVWVNAKSIQPRHWCLDMDRTGKRDTPTNWTCNQAEYEANQAFYQRQAYVWVTKGADGLDYRRYGHTKATWPSKASKVVSVCGAGDVVLAGLVLGYGMCLPVAEMGRLAMCAAASSVEHPNTYCPNFTEVMRRYNAES